MKVIKINVTTKTVSYVEIRKGSLEDIYKELGCSTFACPIMFKNGDVLYCDDEALLKTPNTVFVLPECPTIMGNALIIGSTSDGDSKSCVTKVGDVSFNILFGIPIPMNLNRQKNKSVFSDN